MRCAPSLHAADLNHRKFPMIRLQRSCQRLVTVQQYRDLAEAQVAKGVLDSAGIPCYLRDENAVRTGVGLVEPAGRCTAAGERAGSRGGPGGCLRSLSRNKSRSMARFRTISPVVHAADHSTSTIRQFTNAPASLRSSCLCPFLSPNGPGSARNAAHNGAKRRTSRNALPKRTSKPAQTAKLKCWQQSGMAASKGLRT